MSTKPTRTRTTPAPTPPPERRDPATPVADRSDDPAPIMTVDEVAHELRISRGLAFAAVRAGTLPSIRIGRRILIPRDQLDAFLRGNLTCEHGQTGTSAAS